MALTYKKLEQYKWFPYIAWSLCIGLAFFVGKLTLDLHTTAQNLERTTMTLEERVDIIESWGQRPEETDDDDNHTHVD